MKQRELGRTGLKVGEIGFGTEYLHGQSTETVVEVVREAVARGVSYFDVLWAYPEYLDDLGAALAGLRDRVTLTVHVGSTVSDGQHRLSRDAAECEAVFEEKLGRLGTDRADIALVQHVDAEEDYAAVTQSGGLLELARRMKEEGRARFVGVSSHVAPLSEKAVRSGEFDVLMFPITPAFDGLPGELGLEAFDAQTEHAKGEAAEVGAERRRLYQTCAAEGVGLVAMKPFAGGRFFHLTEAERGELTPVKLLSYVLSQPGVSTVVPGVKNVDELSAALEFVDATEDEREFGAALAGSAWSLRGSCVFCNHCLPCPSGIDIGRTLRLLAIAEQGVSAGLRAEYEALPAKASECVECGVCEERCPFGVEAVGEVARAAEVLEG